ncbi:hypothetical protein SH449x_002518 [Pirellulaceae bacterium SH449]
MTWRRRLLGTSALIGVSVLCFRPVMTTGIERRLSEQLRTPVTIGTTRLALSSSVVQLQRFRVDDKSCPLFIDELTFKFDGHGLLFRDCVVESFLGNGLKWHLPRPIVDHQAARLSIPNVSEQSGVLGLELQTFLTEATRSLQDAEKLSVARAREIDLRIDSVKSRLDDVIYASPAPNPLRSDSTIQKLRSDLIAVQSLLASDRVEASKIDAATTRSLEKLSSKLQAATERPSSLDFSTEDLSSSIFEQSMTVVAAQIQPYIAAAESSYLRFLHQIPSVAHDSSQVSQTQSRSRAGRDLVTDKVPEREFALKRGRILGQSIVGDQAFPTDVTIGSVRLNRSDANFLQIVWKDPLADDEQTVCRIAPSIGADDTLTHLLNLVHRKNASDVTVQANYSNAERETSISFALSHVLDHLDGLEPDLIGAMRRLADRQNVDISASSQNAISESSFKSYSNWIGDEESFRTLKSMVEMAVHSCLEERFESWLSQLQSEYSSGRRLLESRRLAFEEERHHRHIKWTDTIKGLESKINAYDHASRSALNREPTITR